MISCMSLKISPGTFWYGNVILLYQPIPVFQKASNASFFAIYSGHPRVIFNYLTIPKSFFRIHLEMHLISNTKPTGSQLWRKREARKSVQKPWYLTYHFTICFKSRIVTLITDTSQTSQFNFGTHFSLLKTFWFVQTLPVCWRRNLYHLKIFSRNEMILMFFEIQNYPTYHSQEKEILFTDSPEYSAFTKQ